MAREQRLLAAILDADVVGYSRLMGRDESGTVARLRELRTGRRSPCLGEPALFMSAITRPRARLSKRYPSRDPLLRAQRP
jgi:hypothetical protein